MNVFGAEEAGDAADADGKKGLPTTTEDAPGTY